MMARARAVKIVVGVVISLVLIGYVIATNDWGAVWREIARINLPLLLASTLLVVVHYVFRAWRWRELIVGGEATSLRDRLDGFALGNLANYLLPLRAGEIVRPLLLAQWRGLPFPRTLASVVVERFLDLSFVLLSFSWLLTQVPVADNGWLFHGARALGGLALVLLGAIIVGSLCPRLAASLSHAMLRYLPDWVASRVGHLVDDVLAGLGVLRSPRRLMFALITTTLVWGSCYLQYALYLIVFGVEPTLAFSIGVTVCIALAVAAPSAPGFLGVYQVGCEAAFALFGMDRSVGTAFGLVTHVHQYVLILVWGAGVLIARGLGLNALHAKNGNTPSS